MDWTEYAEANRVKDAGDREEVLLASRDYRTAPERQQNVRLAGWMLRRPASKAHWAPVVAAMANLAGALRCAWERNGWAMLAMLVGAFICLVVWRLHLVFVKGRVIVDVEKARA